MPFSSLASTASSSNAMRVPRASWSNASKAWDDFRDSFDKINDVQQVDDIALYSSNGTEYGKDWLYTVGYYDKSVYKMVDLVWDNTFKYYKLPPGDYSNVSFQDFRLAVLNSRLPSSGTYFFKYNIYQSAVVNEFSSCVLQYDLVQKNTLNVYPHSSALDFTQSGSNLSGDFNVKIPSRCVRMAFVFYFKQNTNISLTLSAPNFSFSVLTDASKPTADSGVKSDPSKDTADNTATIAENSNRQVEQGDSIIELIKNTIQTISSQLESFWNQLAGEFTNLYNKMNQQHAEKLQSDQDTRDTITEESEKSRNFIVDGIINGLKSLFIPSDDYFKAWFDDMYTFFNDRFGFLMFPVDLLVQMVNLYLNADSSFAGVPFPEFKWIDGTVVIPAQNVQFTFLETDWGQGIQQKLYFVGNIIMIGALLSLMHRKFEEVLRN